MIVDVSRRQPLEFNDSLVLTPRSIWKWSLRVNRGRGPNVVDFGESWFHPTRVVEPAKPSVYRHADRHSSFRDGAAVADNDPKTLEGQWPTVDAAQQHSPIKSLLLHPPLEITLPCSDVNRQCGTQRRPTGSLTDGRKPGLQPGLRGLRSTHPRWYQKRNNQEDDGSAIQTDVALASMQGRLDSAVDA